MSATTAISAPLTVVRSWHDDWIVNVLLGDGRLYAFQTEIWPQHSDPGFDVTTQSNFAAVKREAEACALACAARNAEPFCAELDTGLDEKQLRAVVDSACRLMDDVMFRRLIR
jgi:hypothetical protein